MADPKEDELKVGCAHYQRKCAFITPCCNKVYTCRVCHDEEQAHQLDRTKVQKVQCLKCEEQQPVQEKCSKCGITFGNYFCGVCRLYDDVDKKQFHCDGCGICRVGGREKYFHCPKCDMCLANDVKESHKCIEQASHANCPVCLEDLHTSRIPATVPPCGHLLHMPCYRDMFKNGQYACPICGQSMVSMEEVWASIDEEVASTPMPDEYKDFHVQILCRDCHKESRVRFHVLGLKCQECGSYNTCRAAEPGQETPGDVPGDGQGDGQGDGHGAAGDGDS